MGYLNKSTITVDAVLTKKGREILSRGQQAASEITQFAVADDEVDYSLYTTSHPLGSTLRRRGGAQGWTRQPLPLPPLRPVPPPPRHCR